MNTISSQDSQHLATNLIGCPYVRGGVTPAGFDCWGLVFHFYAKLGINIDKDYGVNVRASTRELLRLTEQEKLTGQWIPLDTPQHLCLTAMARSNGVTHVGIWLGNGVNKVLHCLNHVGVVCQTTQEIKRLSNFNSKFYKWHKST